MLQHHSILHPGSVPRRYDQVLAEREQQGLLAWLLSLLYTNTQLAKEKSFSARVLTFQASEWSDKKLQAGGVLAGDPLGKEDSQLHLGFKVAVMVPFTQRASAVLSLARYGHATTGMMLQR